MIKLTPEEYLMDTVRPWHCKNYNQPQTEFTLDTAWEALRYLREKCIRVYPKALDGIHHNDPYDYWKRMILVYQAVRRGRPDIACSFATELLHFTAIKGNYEKRVLAILIMVLKVQPSTSAEQLNLDSICEEMLFWKSQCHSLQEKLNNISKPIIR